MGSNFSTIVYRALHYHSGSTFNNFYWPPGPLLAAKIGPGRVTFGVRGQKRTAVYNHWTGLVDWTSELDWWTGLVDWTGGLTLKSFLHIPVMRLRVTWKPCSLLSSYMVLEKITHKASSISEGLCTQCVKAFFHMLQHRQPDFSKVPKTTNEVCNLVNCPVVTTPHQHITHCNTQVYISEPSNQVLIYM